MTQVRTVRLRADDASPRPQSLIQQLTTHCDLWINTPGEHLRALQYTYTLGNDPRRVERWKDSANEEVAMAATLLLQRN